MQGKNTKKENARPATTGRAQEGENTTHKVAVPLPCATIPDDESERAALLASVDFKGTWSDFLQFSKELALTPAEALQAFAEKDVPVPFKIAEKPLVYLPGGGRRIIDAGHELGTLLGHTGRFYNRGGSVQKLYQGQLTDAKPIALASDFETVAKLMKAGDKEGSDATCSEWIAKQVAASEAFMDSLPPLNLLAPCPVLLARGGDLIQVVGYDRESGILAQGKPPESLSITEAKPLLSELVDGFQFATHGDRARALAALITPALLFGDLLGDRAPVDLGEANESQTGKGYRNKITAAVYGQQATTITQNGSRGVGSIEETFDTALLRGSAFIALDNIRGKLDPPKIESFLTEDVYQARAPYRAAVEIDPRRTVVMFTSNKADLTGDLANRIAIVRMLKRPDGHHWKVYPEGCLLEHVRANQPLYLGAVFAIVRAWFAAEMPRNSGQPHDRQQWASALDWIVRELLDAGPLLDGHRDAQRRTATPALNWLRDVALKLLADEMGGQWLRANEIARALQDTDIEIPGLRDGDMGDDETANKVFRATGTKLASCFRDGESVIEDGLTIDRQEQTDSATRMTRKHYRFARTPETNAVVADLATTGTEPSGDTTTDVERSHVSPNATTTPQPRSNPCKNHSPTCATGATTTYDLPDKSHSGDCQGTITERGREPLVAVVADGSEPATSNTKEIEV
jgi:predicted kinase